MNKSNIEVSSARTGADNNSTAQNHSVSQPNANTNVVGSLFKSREIKFKYIFKTYDGRFFVEFFTLKELEYGGLQNFLFGLHDIIIVAKCQYTGLKDRKDKEIYEGDKTIRGCVIMWSKKHGLFCEHFYRKFFNEWSEASYPMFAEGIEIIGNVFENPELLHSVA